MRTLIVAYSLTGTTEKVAAQLAAELGADTVEIHCSRYGKGFVGFMKACFDGLNGRLPPIETKTLSPQAYDLVIAGAPIWAGHTAPPIRTFLKQNRGLLKSAAFFVTCGGSPTASALAEMGAVAGLAPIATLSLNAQEIQSGKSGAAIHAFAQGLTQKKAA